MFTPKERLKRKHDRFHRWWNSKAGKKYKESNKKRINANHKKYRQSPKGKICQIKKAQRMKLKFPEKWESRKKLRNAVRLGKIKKLPCEKCGNKEVFGHHEDYSQSLIVHWLCRIHHREAHNNQS